MIFLTLRRKLCLSASRRASTSASSFMRFMLLLSIFILNSFYLFLNLLPHRLINFSTSNHLLNSPLFLFIILLIFSLLLFLFFLFLFLFPFFFFLLIFVFFFLLLIFHFSLLFLWIFFFKSYGILAPLFIFFNEDGLELCYLL